MAVSLAQIPLFADVAAERLEKKIDAELHRAFSAQEPPESVTVQLWPEGISVITAFHRDMADRLVRRYRAAGWIARCITGNDRKPGIATFYPALILETGGQTRQSAAETP